MPVADSMKKLSPSDPYSYRYKMILILRPNIIVSKIIAKLRNLGIRYISLQGSNNIEVTVTRKDIGEIISLVNDIFSHIRECVEMVCHELYMVTSVNPLEKLRKEQIIAEHRDQNSIKAVIEVDGKYLWIYGNLKRNKYLVRRIKSKIISKVFLDPEFISENMFIECTTNTGQIPSMIKNDSTVFNKAVSV